ncbi:hypothetical protein [Alkalihalobacillus sp. AL-G]|uniref:hypothetical protein n=1 Tax=Alkalihalobacillus sp. AL-G TaxID=2926399 RepID=UPI00272A8229|nr:hypothetical protein [Alkalihalobacillus sp. AL-G]WLD92363.1 hypothetical protein MOJ78_15255 [Alkalihalobacillus sp. AL-G]
MKNRILLSLLLAIALVYFAVPFLPEMGTGISAWFSLLWLAFAMLVIGGNFSTLLFKRINENKEQALSRKRVSIKRRRVRQY